MPGWDADPNLEAANIIAYGYGFTGDDIQTFGQFSVPESTDKVQNFNIDDNVVKISFRFDAAQFPEP
ncbi:hypothetical protein KAR91_38395 [Candidatus Pacearchaeota archaeon]|nr:hypothetical protein [Candidatus Pacearchaeota archaeon]